MEFRYRVNIAACSRGHEDALHVMQAHGVALGMGGTIVVAVTATLAAIGAAAIPSAGLVTMLMVLQVRAQMSTLLLPNAGSFVACPGAFCRCASDHISLRPSKYL